MFWLDAHHRAETTAVSKEHVECVVFLVDMCGKNFRSGILEPEVFAKATIVCFFRPSEVKVISLTSFLILL